MNRRGFLASAGALAVGGLAGCLGRIENRPTYAPPVVEDRPDAVYHPSHVEGTDMLGTKSQGPYGCALMYTYPHRFWLVTGTRTERVSIQSEDTMHLMATVWDRETGTVLPDASPSLEITAAGADVATVNPWSMLSQPMGMHFGDNVALSGEGSYTVEMDVASPSLPRYGEMSAPDAVETCSFQFEYSRADRDDLSVETFPEKQGTKTALPAMDMKMVPSSTVPEASAMPGRTLGTVESGDARFVVLLLDDRSQFGGSVDQQPTTDQQYLAVSPRTPYNRYGLPFMALSATATRADRTVVDAPLRAGLHADFGVHYGAMVEGLESGDEIEIAVETPPQLARHEGYETAFLDMPAVQVTV